MYISGHLGNFENRLHQLPTGFVDLNLFQIEGKGYTGQVEFFVRNKWNKEYCLKQYQFTNSGQFLTGKIFI